MARGNAADVVRLTADCGSSKLGSGRDDIADVIANIERDNVAVADGRCNGKIKTDIAVFDVGRGRDQR